VEGESPLSEHFKRASASHQALPPVGLHGLALAGYPPRRWAAEDKQLIERELVVFY